MKIVFYEKVASSACNLVNYTHAFRPDNHQTQCEAEAEEFSPMRCTAVGRIIYKVSEEMME